MEKKSKQTKQKSTFSQKYNAFLEKDWNITKKWKYFLLIPAIIVLAGIIIVSIINFNLGLDFTGGTIVEIEFGTGLNDSDYNSYKTEIESVLKDNNVNDYDLQKQGSASETTVSIKFQDISGLSQTEMEDLISDIATQIEDELKLAGAPSTLNVADSQRIGASASQALLTNALLAISIAGVLMLIYIAIRFEFASGVAAIVALLHDVLIMCALVAIFRIQINSSFIAAIITIIGYSINNTIVIFDRIRENLRKPDNSKLTNSQMVDVSVKQTLTRTIYTSLTTLVAVVFLAIIGVAEIREFVIPIIIGLVAGTYSSMFVSGTIWSFIYKKSNDKRLQKRIEADKLKEKNKQTENPDKIIV